LVPASFDAAPLRGDGFLLPAGFVAVRSVFVEVEVRFVVAIRILRSGRRHHAGAATT
jgi:hypothetical protein